MALECGARIRVFTVRVRKWIELTILCVRVCVFYRFVFESTYVRSVKLPLSFRSNCCYSQSLFSGGGCGILLGGERATGAYVETMTARGAEIEGVTRSGSGGESFRGSRGTILSWNRRKTVNRHCSNAHPILGFARSKNIWLPPSRRKIDR